MATLYVSFFSGVEKGVASDPLSTTAVTTSTTSAQATVPTSAVVAALHSDTAHYVTVGSNPTAAATNSFYLPANVTREIRVAGGYSALKIAAITA